MFDEMKGDALTIIRFPEVNESPIEPNLGLFLAFAVHDTQAGIRENEGVRSNRFKPVVVTQMLYTANEEIDSQTSEDWIYCVAAKALSASKEGGT